MPNRIIKESICTSETLDGLTAFEETLFFRLLVKCDDYGRYYADPRILRGNLFPLKTLTNKQLDVAVTSLASAGIVEVYTVDGRAYLHLLAWDKHQTVRAKSSKFPPPCECLQASENICMQVQADVPVFENVFENDNAAAQTPYSEIFEAFYSAYPKKKGKADAYKAWKKIKPDKGLLTKMLAAIEAALKTADWQKDGGAFIPYPATWLNGRRWEDEIEVKQESGICYYND